MEIAVAIGIVLVMVLLLFFWREFLFSNLWRSLARQ